MSVAGLYQYNFLVGIVPVLCCFPYNVLSRNKKEALKCLFVFCIPYMFLLLIVLWMVHATAAQFQVAQAKKLIDIFSLAYWQNYDLSVGRYIVVENFTLIFALCTLLGIVCVFRNPLLWGERYILG